MDIGTPAGYWLLDRDRRDRWFVDEIGRFGRFISSPLRDRGRERLAAKIKTPAEIAQVPFVLWQNSSRYF